MRLSDDERRWLVDQFVRLGSYAALAGKIGVSEKTISHWIAKPQQEVQARAWAKAQRYRREVAQLSDSSIERDTKPTRQAVAVLPISEGIAYAPAQPLEAGGTRMIDVLQTEAEAVSALWKAQKFHLIRQMIAEAEGREGVEPKARRHLQRGGRKK